MQTKALIQCVCLLISAFKHLSPEEEELEYYEMPLKYGVE